MVLRVPGSGDIPIPLIVPSDAGNFVKALSQAPPGKNLLAFGDLMTWSDYVKLWSKTTGVPASFEHSTVAVLDKLAPGGYGEGIGEMYAYAQDFGYWGGDPSVIYAKDVSLPMHQCNEILWPCRARTLLLTVFPAWHRISGDSDRGVHKA
jgi:hypothetical protein